MKKKNPIISKRYFILKSPWDLCVAMSVQANVLSKDSNRASAMMKMERSQEQDYVDIYSAPRNKSTLWK